ncbi:MAG TPA: asparagine synthase-related protein [Candidatus Acidoferrales bacterium]|nr:asparagine synthase-related protein [Candidatus Acidoferrales bacterium]
MHIQVFAREINGWPQSHWKSYRQGPDPFDIFVWGQPFIASDARFDKGTEVRRADPRNICELIGALYANHGTEAFALLEGNFCLLVSDPVAREVFLVVDKYGCEDIFIRADQAALRFASHPQYLMDAATQINPLTAAFFLAHEGFVPASFTLFDEVKTIGRGRFLQCEISERGPNVTIERYWHPSRTWDLKSNSEAIHEFLPLLRRAVEPRQMGHAGLLLSGGTDSSLLANLVAERQKEKILALTGGVATDDGSRREIGIAHALAEALGISHEAVVLDPSDETLPNEWELNVQSWVGGTRITLPLFYRFGIRQRQVFGKGCGVFSGQMADTLADNNYTGPSLGYLFRRGLFSANFLKLLPLLQNSTRRMPDQFRKWFIEMVRVCAGSRVAWMLESLLDGLTNAEHFYDGRMFGYGEMPGRSRKYFPALTVSGFECVADWYSDCFVRPLIERLEEGDFYCAMTELSMDMAMLHLDTRLVFHALRLGGARAEMPFLDSRVVNFFVSLPSSGRALYREPKHVIRAQLKKPNMARPRRRKWFSHGRKEKAAASFDELLLRGTLGEYFRGILSVPTFFCQAPGIFGVIDERYLFSQLQAFLSGAPSVNYKFISRLGALEMWSRMLGVQTCSARLSGAAVPFRDKLERVQS